MLQNQVLVPSTYISLGQWAEVPISTIGTCRCNQPPPFLEGHKTP